MKILLLGGTGAIGKYLVHFLLDERFVVHVTTRRKLTSEVQGLSYLHVNAMELDSLSSCFDSNSYDVIVDLMVYNTKQFSERYELLLKNCKKYVYVSTYRVFADIGLDEIDEQTPFLLDVCTDASYLKTDEYALTKARQELILRNSKYDNWSIVRPSITYSTNRFQFGIYELNSFFPRIRHGLKVPASRLMLKKHTVMTWAGDTARMISCVIASEDTYRQSYNVVTGESVSWFEVSEYYKREIGLRLFKVDERSFEKYLDNPWQYKYDRLLDRKCNNQKILSLTGLTQSDLKTVKDGLSYELSNYDFQNSSEYMLPRDFGRLDRLTNDFSLKLFNNNKDRLKYFCGRFSYLDSFLQLKEKL